MISLEALEKLLAEVSRLHEENRKLQGQRAMKLYAWQPGHGQVSFFVMAQDEAAAQAAVEARIRSMVKNSGCDDEFWYRGWGDPDWYTLTVAEEGVVLTNNND